MRKGFTLVEVMITVVVLSVGIVAIHQALGRCLQAVKHSEEVLFASFLNERLAVSADLATWDPLNKEPVELPSSFDDAPGYSLKAEHEAFTRGDSTLDGVILKTTGPGELSSQAGFLLIKNEDKLG